MGDRIPISYWEFYDWPRNIDFQFGERWYYLSSQFDEEKDDYPNFYDVYLLPFRTEEDLKADPHYWRDLSGAEPLGRILIADVGLDKTRRRSIDADRFSHWLSTRKQEPAPASAKGVG